MATVGHIRVRGGPATDGFDVLVQLVMEAMTTEPWVRATSFPFTVTLADFFWGQALVLFYQYL
jgi:hypothetical protein